MRLTEGGTQEDSLSLVMVQVQAFRLVYREIRPGLVGPKARPKGVADGQLVNIPVPSHMRLTEGVTQEDSSSLVMVQVQAQRLCHRQIRDTLRLKRDGEGCKKLNLSDSTLTRKPS